MAQLDQMKKLTFWVNTGLMSFVAFMIWAFTYYGVNIMVWQSIPTAIAYVGMYWLVHKGKLDVYVLMVYLLITAYMITATLCLGVSAGYLLYCMSLIPLSFYMEYLGDQLHTRKMNAMVTSAILVALFLGLAWYVTIHGPIYEVESVFLLRCLIGNAIGVFCFLIGYTRLVTTMVRDSEKQLSDMAHKDQLTGLFNRHYLMSRLEALCGQPDRQPWAAMIDIDDFKNVNDTYGHQAGDYVLTELARVMREGCPACEIARWGGEEFLIVSDGTTQYESMLESLRRSVADAPFAFDGTPIPVTITVGVTRYEAGQSLDQWIRAADSKLYQGKGSGKNRVIE